jgi:2-furoyl-CoA dehydrogenase FAD binding subunit
VKPAPFRYLRPASVEETVAQLAEHGFDAKVIAGGQSLVPLLNMRMARPEVLIDINRVVDLDNVGADADATRVGALVRQARFTGVSPLVDLCLPLVGHYVTRNRGTVGGSIAHADAKAELPLALLALDGSVVAASVRGRREIPADEFFVTHFTTALEPDELVVETVWPVPAVGSGFGFRELALRRGDYAIGMAACALRLEDGRAAGTRIAIGATVDRPTLLREGAALVEGSTVDQSVARAAGEAARAAVEPLDGLHASAGYQRHVTALMVERAVLAAWNDARGVAP